MDFTIARKKGSGAIIWSEEQIRYIIDEYVKKDRTLKELSFEFKVQPQSIRNLLRKQKIKITNKKTKDYPRNSNYFEVIDSSEKAYWLGILLSDGSIVDNSINLRMKDKDHVEKFRSAIGAVNKITEIADNRWTNQCLTYHFSIRDKKMVSNLSKFGMIQNKTYLGFDFPNIPEEYYWDFIRGYFDGDGSIYWTNNKYILSIVGNKNFLEKVKIIFEKPGLSLCQNLKSEITYDLKISGKDDVKRILNLMYKNSTESTRLNRKYINVKSALSNSY